MCVMIENKVHTAIYNIAAGFVICDKDMWERKRIKSERTCRNNEYCALFVLVQQLRSLARSSATASKQKKFTQGSFFIF